MKDLRWTLLPANASEPSRVAMEIRLDSGWVSLDRFDAAVVNQSLRYAADRRVIATTITPGDGKVIGRMTYLHPALADTPLGCRVVEADRFVDTFSFASPQGPMAPPLAQLASDRQQVGYWMRTVELAEKVAAIPSYEACPQDEIENVIKELNLRAVKVSPTLADSFERFLAAKEKKSVGSTNFLRNAHACATSKTETLAGCLCDKVKGDRPPK